MNKYQDMIRMERPKSTHPKMSREMRAAQFSPFSALSGHDEAIKEAQRITSRESILSEDYRCELDYILSAINEDTSVEITYFLKDKLKKGGSYCTVKSQIKVIDKTNGKIILANDSVLKISEIKKIKVIQ